MSGHVAIRANSAANSDKDVPLVEVSPFFSDLKPSMNRSLYLSSNSGNNYELRRYSGNKLYQLDHT